MKTPKPVWLVRAVLAISLLAGFSQPARAEGEMPKEQLEAYKLMVQADQARQRGAFKEALQGYREAELNYKLVAKGHPEWHPEIVQYRLTYCANQVAAMLAQIGKTEDQLMAEPAVNEGELAKARAKQTELLKAQNTLQEKLSQADQEAEAARQQALAREAELNRAKEEKTGLKEKLTDIAQDAEAARKKLQADLQELKSENERLKSDLATQTDAGKLAARDAAELRASTDNLSREKEKISQELDDAKRAAAGLDAENKKLAQDRDEVRATAEAANQKIAELGAELEKQTADLGRLKEKDAELARIADLESKSRQELDAAAKALAAKDAELEKARQNITALERGLALQEDAVSARDGALTRVEAERVKLAEELAVAKEATKGTADLAAAKQAADKQIRLLQESVATLTDAGQKQKEELTKLAEENASLGAGLQAAQAVAETKTAEASTLSERSKTLEKDLKARDAEVASLDARVGSATEKAAQTTEELNSQVATLKEQLAAQAREAGESTADRDRWASKGVQLQQKVDSLTADLAGATKDRKALQDEISAIQAQVKSFDKAIAQKTEALANAEQKSLMAVKRANESAKSERVATERIQSLEKDLAAERAGRADAQNTVTAREADISALRAEQQAFQKAEADVRGALAKMQEERDQRQSGLEAAQKQLEGSRAALEELKADRSSIVGQLEDARKRNDAYSLSLKQKSEELERALGQEELTQRENATLRSSIDTSGAEIGKLTDERSKLIAAQEQAGKDAEAARAGAADLQRQLTASADRYKTLEARAAELDEKVQANAKLMAEQRKWSEHATAENTRLAAELKKALDENRAASLEAASLREQLRTVQQSMEQARRRIQQGAGASP